MTPFTPIDYDEATERRLAIRLWTLYLTFIDEKFGKDVRRGVNDAAFRSACAITCDILGYGMAPFGVETVVREAYVAHVTEHGPMPSPLDTGSRPIWREALTDAVVAGLRGLR